MLERRCHRSESEHGRRKERVGEDSGVDAVNKKRLYNQVAISFWRPETKINKTMCKFNIESKFLDAGSGDFI
jgi:hypothetical protein